MSSESTTLPAAAPVEVPVHRWRRLASPDNRYLPPAFITCILLGGHLSFGILEAYEKTVLAIVTAVVAELVLSRFTYGKWPHLASAYITGISVGILIRSPLLWPYAVCSALSIASKYVLRIRRRHIWNPSNFGVSAMLFLAPLTVAVLSIQWGNSLWPMVIIWALGALTVWRVGRLHICATYVGSFLVFSFLRSLVTGNPWLASLAPITGPMYQLFIFFMITDPRTTVRTRTAQCAVAFAVALVEMILRLQEFVYAPFYALFLVGPTAMLIQISSDARSGRHA